MAFLIYKVELTDLLNRVRSSGQLPEWVLNLQGFFHFALQQMFETDKPSLPFSMSSMKKINVN